MASLGVLDQLTTWKPSENTPYGIIPVIVGFLNCYRARKCYHLGFSECDMKRTEDDKWAQDGYSNLSPQPLRRAESTRKMHTLGARDTNGLATQTQLVVIAPNLMTPQRISYLLFVPRSAANHGSISISSSVIAIATLAAQVADLGVLLLEFAFVVKKRQTFLEKRISSNPHLLKQANAKLNELKAIVYKLIADQSSDSLMEAGFFSCFPSRVNSRLEDMLQERSSAASSDGSFADASEYLSIC
ncbi:hypothetical protein An15g04840 [Aspergillus niger]|uniref:Uncharacterized protein n=2 Tax=Aspergillus niger TaxID=5061 RepID=A2R5M5_ASPNC|nr:hypothetical protein An15g04840 [Aspergillus niger]CAK42461.1 hypothetical protein An15g04840 [Aspergillus niger]